MEIYGFGCESTVSPEECCECNTLSKPNPRNGTKGSHDEDITCNHSKCTCNASCIFVELVAAAIACHVGCLLSVDRSPLVACSLAGKDAREGAFPWRNITKFEQCIAVMDDRSKKHK